MKKLAELWCWIHGHDFISLYRIDREMCSFGVHKCMRCGREESWQVDN